MPTLSLCPECGAEIAAASSRGLCTRCLFSLGLGGGDAMEAAPEAAPAAPVAGEPEAIPGFAPVKRLGDYELLEEIARGGMGVVYRARQISLDRIVAVKVILSGQFASREQALRFRVEAEAAARLQHPNIVAIHETGEHEGQPYFSMDHVAGGSLATLARQHPLAAKRAAALVRTVAEAIHYAHDQGVLHRDLKPTNILLDAAGQPRVTDFGLARRFERDSFLTVTGQVLGSPSFMPPEQAGAKSVKAGRYSDVYSLGGILFHLVTGRPPFVSESVPETLRQVLNSEPVSPRLLNPAVPPDLATICLKCLQKEPGKRYATAQLLAEDLGRFLQDQPIAARPVGRVEKLWRWGRREPVVAGLGGASFLLAILLGLGGPILAYRAREEAFRARQNLYAADIGTAQQAINEGDLGRARDLLSAHIPGPAQTDLRGFEWRYLWSRLHGDAVATFSTNEPPRRHLAISPDGRLLAAGNQLWATDSRQVVNQLGKKAEALAFTRDGAGLLLNHNGDFRRWNPLTGEESVLLEQEPAEAIAVSATGEWLAVGTRRGLRLFELPGGRLAGSCTNAPFDVWSALDPTHSPFHFFSAKGLAFAPDGRRLLVASGHPMDHLSRLSCWSIPALQPVPVPENPFANDTSAVVFAPGGREFVTAHWDGHLGVWDTATMTEIRARRRPGAHHGWIGDMAFIPGGSRLVTAGADRCVRVWETGTWEPSLTLRGHEGEIWALAPSPDGRLIHTAACDGRLNQWLPASPIPDDAPISRFGSPLLPAGISPDGRLLATVSEQAVRFWRIQERAIREETPARVDLWGSGPVTVAVSPDARWLAISRPNVLVELAGLGLAPTSRQLAAIPAGGARLGFSPDSRLLACADANGQVALIEPVTGRKTDTLAAPGKTDVVFPFFFASRANVLAVAGTRSVRLWDTVARRVTREIKAVDSGLFVSFAISADASMLAMGYTDNHFTLHDCRTGAQIDRVSSHVSGVDWLSFSPDGKTLATASGRWVRLWDLRTRREMLPLEHAAKVIYLAFTPDGNALVTAEMGGVTRVWRAPPSPGK